MLKQPTRISRYDIKTLIAAGGMGALYLARDTNPNTNRLVAVKLLNATLDSRELRDRFAREARSLAALDHPSIVGIFDSGEYQGSPFIVMEYVRGETLAEKIKRRAPMTIGQKLKLMVELCSGLAHAHEAGIVHRDIKPANLMVDQHGRLKILDFGIARAEGTFFGTLNIRATQINVAVGTPGYMSPEQIEGDEIDGRTDIFAAGAVFYELLAYREAFPGSNTRQIENKVLEARPEPLSLFVPNLAPAIEEIVRKALAKSPRDRYQTAAAFEEALQRQLWALGPVETPAAAGRSTPPAGRETALHGHESRSDAAYRRCLALYDEGAVDAARRFAIEALAENPGHREARAFVESLGGRDLPPPPPLPAEAEAEEEEAPTVLASGIYPPSSFEPAAPTVLGTAPVAPRPAPAKKAAPGAAALWTRHRGALLVAGIAAGVVIVVGLAILLAVALWPRGPQLTVQKPTGGTVWTTGITCGTTGSDCTANVAEGETVQLQANADPGFLFAGFGGDCTTGGRVHMIRNATCVALFNPLPKEAEKLSWMLTVVKPANGNIVGPGGIRCGSVDAACSVQYPDGAEVKLDAYADPNFAFRGFTGDCTADGRTTMKAARTCAATFVAEQKAATTTPTPVPIPRGPSTRGAGRAGSTASGTGAEALQAGQATGNIMEPVKPSAGKNTMAPPLPPEELAKADIKRLLDEYRDAYERMDLKGVERTFPGAPLSQMKLAFDSYKSLKFAMEGPPEYLDVDPGRGVARVKAKFLVTPEVKVGSQKPVKREETFIMEQRAGVWLIRGWEVKILK